MKNQFNHFLFAAVWLLWAIISFNYLTWFFGHLSLHFDLLHASLFAAVVFFWLRKGSWKFSLPLRFYKNPHALILGLFSLLLLIFFKTQSPIRIFGFVTALFLGYSLLGLVMPPQRWKRNLIPFSLLVMTLPFGRHLDVFIGYPLRMLSVEAAHLALVGILPDLSSVSGLLIIENRASQVDMDCSGLKGIWVGLLLYFVMSWLENCRISGKWVLGAIMFIAYLVLGNFFRIILLSLIHLHWEKPAMDPWIHHSTSVFFLLTGVGLCYWFLHFKAEKRKEKSTEELYQTLSAPAYFHLGILVLFMVPLWLPSFGTSKPWQKETAVVNAVEEQGWLPIKLSAAEQTVYDREGVQGFKFEKGKDQLILVLNGDWRSQHKPELCYELSGLPLAGIRTLLMEKNFPVRQLKFQDRQEKAYFWFQSGKEVTEDFATKVWNQLKGHQQEWTLVSFLSRDGVIPKEEILNIHQLLIDTKAKP